MSTSSLSVKDQIIKIVKRFKFEEIESTVLTIFPEFKWDKIKRQLIDDHESFTTFNVVQIIYKLINKVNLSNQILIDRLATLELIDVSRHYNRKVWYSYEFISNSNKNSLKLNEITKKIEQNFNEYQMEMNVKIIEYNDIIFISLKIKSKKNKTKTFATIFFSVTINENYFFCSKSTVSKYILLAVTHGLGYLKYRQIKLTGKDIPSLVRLLLGKKKAMLEGQFVNGYLPFKPTLPRRTSLGLDFTQRDELEVYCKQCFGDNPPTFEFLRVRCLNAKWKDKDALAKLSDNDVHTEIEFRSENIMKFLKNLITQRILTVPIPSYAADILKIGRNDINLKIV